ncbi:MAG: response regulator [Anaerolineae bacterium]|jgi:two-component system cell cycle response regulator DivK
MKVDTSGFNDLHALVVEDDAGGMAIIGVMMRYLGINVVINTTGEGVLSMAHAMNPKPNIFFLDINLPRTTGYEIIKQIRSDPTFANATVVAVTAQDADTEIPKCREAGFNAYIGKPISRMRFPRQLRRILAGEEVWETY